MLFIQQPFYTLATKYLKKKISEFKVTEDVRLESNDFVKRPAYAEEEINKIMREGVKVNNHETTKHLLIPLSGRMRL